MAMTKPDASQVKFGTGTVADLSAPSGASLIGSQLAVPGSVLRTVQDELSDTAKMDQFGVVGDGSADDTLAMLAAFVFCRANNKTLLISGSPTFNAATVPAGSTHAGSSGNYVYGCSMAGYPYANLLVTGKIGFDLLGVNHTVLENFSVTTSGRQITEADATGSSPYLFITTSGTKASSVYRNLVIYHNVTDLTGAYRAGVSISDYGCSSVLIDNVVVSNSITAFSIFASSSVTVRNTYSYNIEVNLFCDHTNNIQVNNVHLVNTGTQQAHWASRLATVPRLANGMDNVVTQYCNDVTIVGLHTVYALERAAYIQASNAHISDCFALNCDGYKVVGSSLTDFVANAVISNCHVTLDASFSTSFTGIALVMAYLGSNLVVQDCTINNVTASRTTVSDAAIVIGLGASTQTYNNVNIRNVSAINIPRLVWVITGGITATVGGLGVALINPLALQTIKIFNCHLQCCVLKTYGALMEVRDGGYLTGVYAVQDVEICNNVIDLASDVNLRPDWVFDIRWVNGAVSANNRVNAPFANGGFFTSALGALAPYVSIKMDEQYVQFNLDSGVLIERLAYLNLIAGSIVKFTYTPTNQRHVVSASTSVSGPMINGDVTLEVFGKNYANITTAQSFAIQMNASGIAYFGKMIAGVKTDQIGTPPIAITSSSTNISVRGEDSPTVTYYCKLTLV